MNNRLELAVKAAAPVLRHFENELASSLSCDSRSHDADRGPRAQLREILDALEKPDKSGMEPIPDYQPPCCNPGHQPPTHLYIPPGQQYRHICPSCGFTVVIRGNNVSYSTTKR
jgi:hypothetical protein